MSDGSEGDRVRPMATVQPPPHPVLDPPAVDQLAEAMASSGFSAERVGVAVAGSGFGLSALPVLARRLEPGDPLAPLIALFVHGAPVSEDAADRALDPLGLDGALRLAIVRPAEDGLVVSTVRLAPFGDLLLTSDRPEGPFHDFVMGGRGPAGHSPT